MIGQPGTDGNGVDRGGPRLVRRAVVRGDRPSITWKDPAILLWFIVCIVLAPLPRGFRWNVCRIAARLACHTSRARQALARIAHLLNLSPDEAARIVRDLYAGRLSGYADLVRGLISQPDFRIACRGMTHLDAARSEGRGTILWISDFVSAGDVSKVALRREGLRVAHLSRPEHGFTTSRFGMRFLNPLRIKFECRYLAERIVFDRKDPRPAMLRLERIVRANGIVSIMASMHEGGTLADLPFFTGRLKLALGALRLAQLTGATVLPVFVLRDRVDHQVFEVIVAAPLTMPKGPREQGLLEAAHEYAHALQGFVRQRPECWVGWRRTDQLSPGLER